MFNLIFSTFSWRKGRNKGNAKRGVSPRLKSWPSDLDLWLWKSIGLQILLRTKYVPSLVKIQWRMLILECSQGCYGRTDGRKRYYIPSQLRWRGDNNSIVFKVLHIKLHLSPSPTDDMKLYIYSFVIKCLFLIGVLYYNFVLWWWPQVRIL